MHDLEEDAWDFWRARLAGHYAGPELRSTAWLALLFSCLAFGSCFVEPSTRDTQLNANIFGVYTPARWKALSIIRRSANHDASTQSAVPFSF
jgi:hypothetical protein